MKSKKIFFHLFLLMFGMMMFSCGLLNNDSDEYKFTESGIGYKFHVEDQSAPVPDSGSFLTLRLTYGSEDSVFYSSDFIPEGVMKLPMSEPQYEGDLFEALSMMHVGDSASFLIDAESFFLQTAGFPEVPEFAQGVEDLLFNVKLEKVQSQAEMQAETEMQMAEAQSVEKEQMQEYIEENNITAQPTETGMYYVEHKKGSGPKPQEGDKVKVHYTGMLLDGTKFDSSVDRGQPFEFTLGVGQVIRGWDEGIAMMNVGSEATFILPSHMAYGERGAGSDIPPFAPLVFEVELLDVTKE
jgi:FKBP-type peptidyl-prolyl cis-trans isomerase FkpA